ncbi:hypothetical protein H0H92_001281, partial [Tricholoma furcatifolium]
LVSSSNSFSQQVDMTDYGMAYFLEDKTGRLSGSEFVDLNDRVTFTYQCTARDSNQSSYMIYDNEGSQPLLGLRFGPNNALGTIHNAPGSSMQMSEYLKKVTVFGRYRKFIASDGQEYRWNWRAKDDQEWTCTDARGELIAYYHLKTPGEPEYRNSSGCMLTVEQAYRHLIPEMLASLMIMRHIAEYGL